MTHPHEPQLNSAIEPDVNAPSRGASWGGSNASADPAPKGPGADQHQGAQVRQVSTEGGPKPRGNNQTSHRRRRRSSSRQRPRQPRETKRLRQLSARFNDAEFALIKSAAAQSNLSVAAFLARSALRAARDRDRTAAEIADDREVITALFDTRRRLGWAGSNLNQAVKALNSGAEVPQLDTVIAAVRTAADRVHEAASRVIARQQTSA